MDRLSAGDVLEVRSLAPELIEDLKAWAHITRNPLVGSTNGGGHGLFFLRKGDGAARWAQPDWGVRLPKRPNGAVDVRDWLVGRAGDVPEQAANDLGFVPRGAVAETGMPRFPYTLDRKAQVWAPNLAALYEQAKARQWNASTDIPWANLPTLPQDIERAVCQIMTFLAENEYSALYIPAKFLPRINPQYVEAILFLSTVINDEARHVEAFTKRALANGGGLQRSAALSEWSLHSLFVQEDFFRSSFLLHVLGEGTFLDLLAFIERHAPDPVTAEVVAKARADEGRHVSYGVDHVQHCLQAEPSKAGELVAAAEERSAALEAAGGNNPAVTEALAILGGGGSSPYQIELGLEAVRDLYQTMDAHRVQRMLQIGLDEATARKISDLHTANFM